MKHLLLKYRRIAIILAHAFFFMAAYVLSYMLRFDFFLPEDPARLLAISLPVVIIVKLVVFEMFALYQGWWRFVSVSDLSQIIKASILSAITITFFGFLAFHGHGFPRSIPIIDLGLTIIFVGGSRFLVRAFREGHLLTLSRDTAGSARVLIVGAGNAGESLAREIGKNMELHYSIAGFVDDNYYKQRVRIHGYPVLGRIDDIAPISVDYQVDEIFIAIPSATGEQMKRILGICEETGLKIKTIPGMDGLIEGKVSVSQLREVDIVDLLGRDPVNLDAQAIRDYLKDKRVLVTGAAGSIGSEICRQVLHFEPAELILLDKWENGVFEMGRELKKYQGDKRISYFVADVKDRDRIEKIFRRVRPDVVFHAAAYKHVPLMEANPGEAIKNNVGGTKTLADVCVELGCIDRFVMISTDKAVNPTSVMGASKRIAERYVQRLSRPEGVKFITVRFGNVLGSAGSVIPIFKEQIKRGGPVTVTHPNMMRYFMTIPEASQLVLQAGSMGKGGEIFVLDMGEPVKILDLAKTLIKLSGYKPDLDIPIEFTGIRPGEKLFEELCLDEEFVEKTEHAKVFIHASVAHYPEDFTESLLALIRDADSLDLKTIKESIAYLVPEYLSPKVTPLGHFSKDSDLLGPTCKLPENQPRKTRK